MSGITATKEKQEKSLVTINATIPWNLVEKFHDKAITALNQTVKLDGFRPGNIPESVLVSRLGEMGVISEMAEQAINEHYYEILKISEVDAIGFPKIGIKKITKGNPLELSIEVAVVPTFDLPDYKKIAKGELKEKKTIVVEEKEIDDVLLHIRKERVAHNHEHKDGETHDHEHDHKDVDEKDLPPLDDAFAQTVGNFKTLDELKTRVKENLTLEKEARAKEKTRAKIIDALLKEVSIDIPEIIVENELNRLKARMESQIAQFGMTFENYLTQIKKTEEEMKKEWRPEAEGHAKTELILHEISVKEKITATEEEIDAEVKKIIEMYPDADKNRAHAYAEQYLINEKVFSLLENQ